MASSRKPIVIITGASKGIGLVATTILLEELGARVVAISRTRTPELDKLSQTYGDDLQINLADVTNEGDLTHAIESGAKTFGGIDGLILNAGVIEPIGRIDSTNFHLNDWKSHFDVNFFSLITAIRAALPNLHQSKGKIVFVSSGASVGATAGLGPYNAGKAAMNSLCRTLAAEEADLVSIALRPGMIETAMQRTLRERGKGVLDQKDHDRYSQAHAAGKLVSVTHSAYVIATLALRATPALSGQFVSWDGPECEAYRRTH